MTDPNLTEGWPDEPDKAEIEAFARGLAGAIPQLESAALQRVEAGMQDEIARQRMRFRQRNWAYASALAASVLIGAAYFIADWFQPRANVQHPQIVRDVYRVPAVSVPAPLPPDQPLIAIEAHQGLFTN